MFLLVAICLKAGSAYSANSDEENQIQNDLKAPIKQKRDSSFQEDAENRDKDSTLEEDGATYQGILRRRPRPLVRRRPSIGPKLRTRPWSRPRPRPRIRSWPCPRPYPWPCPRPRPRPIYPRPRPPRPSLPRRPPRPTQKPRPGRKGIRRLFGRWSNWRRLRYGSNDFFG